MKREQSLRAAGRAAGGAADELVDRRVERQRARLDFFAQRVPGRESVLARNRRLGVVQRQIRRVAIRRATCLKARAGSRSAASASRSRALAASSSDFACFFSCSRLGRAGSSRDGIQPPCFSPVVRRQAARRLSAVDRAVVTVGLALRANPRAPFTRLSHGSAIGRACQRVGIHVKLGREALLLPDGHSALGSSTPFLTTPRCSNRQEFVRTMLGDPADHAGAIGRQE